MRLLFIVPLFLLMFTTGYSYAQENSIVVVTSSKNQINELEKRELIDLYMGKYNSFANGASANPIDVVNDEELKAKFYKALVGLPLARVNAYWSRLKFSGRAKPPSMENSFKDIQKRLSSDASALAYVYASEVTDEMKVVYRFD